MAAQAVAPRASLHWVCGWILCCAHVAPRYLLCLSILFDILFNILNILADPQDLFYPYPPAPAATKQDSQLLAVCPVVLLE
jgi:hypothetical protein